MKLGRLACQCVYRDETDRILDQLNEIDQHLEAESYKKALKVMKDTVQRMKEEQKIHKEYNLAYARSQCEFHKVASIMAPDAHGHNSSVLRTSAWKAGDLDELRRPVKKKKKKKKKQEIIQKQLKKKKPVFAKPKPKPTVGKKIVKPKKPLPPPAPIQKSVKKTLRVIKIKQEPL